VCSERS